MTPGRHASTTRRVRSACPRGPGASAPRSARRGLARVAQLLRGHVLVGPVLVGLVLVGTGCMPQDRSGVAEVDDGSDSAKPATGPPEFPATGEIPAELLVDGLVYDFTTKPRDQDYWSVPSAEATCAAEGIVEGVGATRLSALGYRVATPGASLNDIGLSDPERTVVVDQFMGCVDMVEGVAAVLFGDGRLTTEAATCVARGLGDQQMLRPFAEAWVFGRAVDPFGSDGAFATALLGQSEVCIASPAFNWPGLRLPEDAPLIDADAPGGSSGSAHEDDRRSTGESSTTTTAAPAG